MKTNRVKHTAPVPQDLHIHTVFSRGDSAVAPEQTLDLIATFGHARVTGISDHLDCMTDDELALYMKTVRGHGFRLGVEICNSGWVAAAAALPMDYYVYHCRDHSAEYAGAEKLLETGRPVIIAHPFFMETDLRRVPPACLIEVNNRYIWRNDWKSLLSPWVGSCRFVLSSDAHQPNWLNQFIARHVAAELKIEETLLFE
ncbi:hypothetical protein HQ520_15180 [bacterium]|nr:hypothetical protein [bacterium]